MATIDFDSSDARDVSRPPISLHPAFPAIVALWFAALLGLGSMVLPVVLLERVVGATGIASLVPAASPPLGFMARGLIALVSGIAGAVIGVVIARRVAQAHDGDRPSRIAKFASGARRPISVNEELGGEPLVNGQGLPVNRRRALAIAEDDRPSDFLYMAPLPGDGEGEGEGESEPVFDELGTVRNAGDEPFELGDAFEDTGEVDPAEFHSAHQAVSDGDEPMTFKQEFQPTPQATPAASMGQEFDKAEAEPLPFSPPSLARRATLAEPEVHASTPEPAPLELVPAAPESRPVHDDWHVAPVGELGLVQLVQRLAASLERRRERLASAPDATSAPLLAPAAGFDPAPPEEAALAMAEFFGKPAGEAPVAPEQSDERPAPVSPAHRPSFPGAWQTKDDDDELDAIPSFTLPLRKAVSPTIAFGEPQVHGASQDEDQEAGDSYSSLLEMRNPFTPKDQGFVRIDEPEQDAEVEPAVVFPGRAGPSFPAAASFEATSRAFDPPSSLGARPEAASQTAAANTDVALRAALATLQRMSGTA